MSVRVDYRFPELTWVRVALVVGAVLTVVWTRWHGSGLDARVASDVVVFVLVPVALARAFGKDLGFRVDRRAVRNAILLAAFVLPFYLVGSTLPTIRSFYPMWGLDSAAPAAFLPHAAKQVIVVVAAETYYRGLLCVGVREIGFKSVFISPVAYALAHAAKALAPGGGLFMIGHALRNLPAGTRIPWHRVINSQGKISLPPGSDGHYTQMQRLLAEGVEFTERGRIASPAFWWPDP